MGCCKCCCGNKNCAQGEQGKCCCGEGAGAECCAVGEYCCTGDCVGLCEQGIVSAKCLCGNECCDVDEYCCDGECQPTPCASCEACDEPHGIDVLVNGNSVPPFPFGVQACYQLNGALLSQKFGRYSGVSCNTTTKKWHVSVQVVYTCQETNSRNSASVIIDYEWRVDPGPDGCPAGEATLVNTTQTISDPAQILNTADCDKSCWDMEIPTVSIT